MGELWGSASSFSLCGLKEPLVIYMNKIFFFLIIKCPLSKGQNAPLYVWER